MSDEAFHRLAALRDLMDRDVDVSDAVRDRVRTRLQDRFGRPTDRRPVRRRLALAAAAVAALVLLGATLLPPWLLGPSRAEAFLLELGQVAGDRDPEALNPGEFARLEYLSDGISTQSSLEPADAWSFRISAEVVAWIANDGSGRLLTTYGDPVFISDEDREAWRRAGSPPLVPAPVEDERFESEELPFVDPFEVPTEASALARYFAERGADDPRHALSLAADILRWGVAPAPVRGAVFRHIAGLPDLELVEGLRARSRVSASGITWRGETHEFTLVFDPATSTLLEERTAGGLDGQQVDLGEIVYLGSRVVDTLEDPPEPA